MIGLKSATIQSFEPADYPLQVFISDSHLFATESFFTCPPSHLRPDTRVDAPGGSTKLINLTRLVSMMDFVFFAKLCAQRNKWLVQVQSVRDEGRERDKQDREIRHFS